MTPRIRRATLRDEAAIARICRLTGNQGQDATGLYGDPTVLADVYATPYLYGPDCVGYVVEEAGEPQGYVLAALDTRAFQDWFTNEWWPARASDHSVKTVADQWLLDEAARTSRCINGPVDDYPAHLHIDLLPELQGKGWGRRLIDTLRAHLAAEGVTGLHLVVSTMNAPAVTFYPKVGFDTLWAKDTIIVYGCDIKAD
jgi:GNAT superfamily N-acetyltransferase